MAWRTNLKRGMRIDEKIAREMLAEFLGTFILIVIGCGSIAQVVLSKETAGGFLTVNFGWWLGVMLGVYVCGGVSGGHINPAITLAMAILGRTPWHKVCFYWTGQYLGAITGAAVVYGVYFDALNDFDDGVRQIDGAQGTAGIFGTYPKPFLSWQSGFGDQIVGTAILAILVLAITDERNMSVPKGLIPVSVGATVGAIGMAYGYNCGYAVNPARDLGPRILTAMAGWGVEVFSYRDYNWFWIPVVGPHIGAIAGALLYQLFVGVHWPDVPISVGHYPKEKMTTGGINNAFSPPEEFEQEPQVKIYTKQADDDDEMTAKF